MSVRHKRRNTSYHHLNIVSCRVWMFLSLNWRCEKF
ncbi:hypothetical protein MED222_04845 [Vibrio sp. MED222]|nr:hypothetical protein MED222_04845 [Vibrio sp. MED222]